MKRKLCCCLFLIMSAAAFGQKPVTEDPEKTWARTSKAIPFQNDSQWEDGRWQATDVGPFVTSTIDTGSGATLKGIAIRVGDQQQAAVCFDTARLQISAAWTGEFLRFGPRRFGLIQKPRAAGKVAFTIPKVAGWANEDRFQPRPNEINYPEIGKKYGISGNSVVHLPKEWAAFRGLYTHNQRVILSYSVGSTNVLESPWYVQAEGHQAFIRSLEISPSTKIMRMWVADPNSQVTVMGDSVATTKKSPNGAPILSVAPHNDVVRIKLIVTEKSVSSEAIEALRVASGDVENLKDLIRSDSGRWPEVLITKGATTESGGPYVIDTITVPFENSYKSLFFTAGHDFFSNGAAAVCTAHGDVWVVTGIDRQLEKLEWRRFATGLFQPLGLKIVDDKVYVIGRDQVTRLHDRNGDGEADFYENFNNDLFVTPGGHDYVTCLDTDPDGNFYFIHAKTGVMRLTADGKNLTSIADGFRNPNGMAVSPDGIITAAPQQGTWTPESSLIVVKPGGYYGFGGPRVTKNRPTGWDLPMCFIPRAMDNSGGAQVWVDSDRWGPLQGQMLHLSYGQCRLLLALTENVDGVFQGGTIKLPSQPADFESGIMRGRFSPHDGQLYVSGLRGWQTRAVRDGCFQRLRYTGGPVHLPVGVKTYTNGIKLTFSEPLDPSIAENPDHYHVEQWNYRWTSAYGSPDYSVANPKQQGRDEVPVVSVTLMQDGRTVFLEMPNRQPVMQISINWFLNSKQGKQFRGSYAHTINVMPKETVPESSIVRRARPRRIAQEIEQRLQPGLQFRFKSTGSPETDTRVARNLALHQLVSDSPTPFLPSGPFSLQVKGTIRIPLSGFYEFRLESRGESELSFNGRLIDSLITGSQTTAPILLQKGHNLVTLSYQSPANGPARLKLWWKGHDFDWETVPGSVFHHDSGAEALLVAKRRRLGRQMFAEHQCIACHQTNAGKHAMFELGSVAPNLSKTSERLSAGWIQQWLLAPKSMRPQAHMPAVLGQGEQAQTDAADIAAFLIASQEDAPRANDPSSGALPSGAVLFESLSCVSCHHFQSPDTKDEFARVSLYFANAKYLPGALARFLLKPNAHDVDSKMPDFKLSVDESTALANYVRTQSKGVVQQVTRVVSVSRGQKLFVDRGCQHCHQIRSNQTTDAAVLKWNDEVATKGCMVADGSKRKSGIPDYRFNSDQQFALLEFIKHDLASLNRFDPLETSGRLFQGLRCHQCHDRDGVRSNRQRILAEEGSGKVPESFPELTRAGERLRESWTEQLLAGKLTYKSRPWLTGRMPAFEAHSRVLARGLVGEHAVAVPQGTAKKYDPKLAAIGEKLTLKTGLDCRQCHGIGNLQPRGDEKTKVHLGINFSHIRDRLRYDAYERFMFDPVRYDPNSKMIKLSEDGITTKLKAYFDADAHQQFDAVWHYIQSLPPSESK